MCLLKVCLSTHFHPLFSLHFPHEQEHVVALNKQIVESGGKPLLGKDPSHISRLERQAEEFLDAVLHRKGEYTGTQSDIRVYNNVLFTAILNCSF